MAFQPAPFTAQVRINLALPDASSGVYVLHVKHGDPSWTEAELMALVARFQANFIGLLRATMSNATSITRIDARDLSNEIAPYYVHDYVPALAGSVNSPAMPSNVALVVTHRTGLTGRSALGRTYLTGLPEGHVTGNFVSAGIASAANAAFAQLLLDLASAGEALAVLSRFSGGVARPVALAFAVVGSLLRDTRVDTQKRRLPRMYGS